MAEDYLEENNPLLVYYFVNEQLQKITVSKKECTLSNMYEIIKHID